MSKRKWLITSAAAAAFLLWVFWPLLFDGAPSYTREARIELDRITMSRCNYLRDGVFACGTAQFIVTQLPGGEVRTCAANDAAWRIAIQHNWIRRAVDCQ